MHSWTHQELSLAGLPGADGGRLQGQQLWAALPTRGQEALVISGWIGSHSPRRARLRNGAESLHWTPRPAVPKFWRGLPTKPF